MGNCPCHSFVKLDARHTGGFYHLVCRNVVRAHLFQCTILVFCQNFIKGPFDMEVQGGTGVGEVTCLGGIKK